MPTAIRGRPSRAPYPYDLVVRQAGAQPGERRLSVGLMLGGAKKGQAGMVARRPSNMDKVAPTDYSYRALPPDFGRTMDVDDWSGGLGCGWREEWTGNRYRLARGVDASSGEPIKGPEVLTFTPTNRDPAGVTGFFEIGGAVHAVNGRYVHKRTSDADWNSGQKDFGAGRGAVDAIRVSFSGAQVALVAMGDSEPIWKTDGATWAQHAEASKLYARAWAICGQDLYRANAGHQLAKLDVAADPFAYANWSADNLHILGDESAPINRLSSTSQGVLVGVKADGIYSLDAVGDSITYHPFLRPAADPSNGFGLGAWLNDLYLPWVNGLQKLGPDFGIADVGLERIPDNDSEVDGRITSAQGHGGFFLYAGLRNLDTGDGYLLKMTREGVWHGSIVEPWIGRYPTCLHVSQVGAPPGHQRMYLGFSDGSVGWFTLPCTAHPASCSQYRYTPNDVWIQTPRLTMGFSADQKTFDALAFKGREVTASENARLLYRVDEVGAFADAGSAIARTQAEIDLPNNTAGAFVEVRLVLKSGSNLATPIANGIGIVHWLNPRQRELYEALALIADGTIRRDGTPIRRPAPDLLRALRALQVGEVEFLLPTEERITGRITEIGETTAWDERLRKEVQAVQIAFAELTKVNTRGTWARVGTFKWSEIAARTWADLKNI